MVHTREDSPDQQGEKSQTFRRDAENTGRTSPAADLLDNATTKRKTKQRRNRTHVRTTHSSWLGMLGTRVLRTAGPESPESPAWGPWGRADPVAEGARGGSREGSSRAGAQWLPHAPRAECSRQRTFLGPEGQWAGAGFLRRLLSVETVVRDFPPAFRRQFPTECFSFSRRSVFLQFWTFRDVSRCGPLFTHVPQFWKCFLVCLFIWSISSFHSLCPF